MGGACVLPCASPMHLLIWSLGGEGLEMSRPWSDLLLIPRLTVTVALATTVPLLCPRVHSHLKPQSRAVCPQGTLGTVKHSTYYLKRLGHTPTQQSGLGTVTSAISQSHKSCHSDNHISVTYTSLHVVFLFT